MTINCGLHRFISEEDAPTMAEYGLLLVFVGVVTLSVVVVLGDNLRNLFQAAAPGIGNPSPPPP